MKKFAFWKSASITSNMGFIQTGYWNGTAMVYESSKYDYNTGLTSGTIAYPQAQGAQSAGHLNSLSAIYFCGGYSGSTAAPLIQTRKLTKATNSFSQIGNMPAGRTVPYCVYNEFRGYICGGSDWTSHTPTNYNTTFKITYATDVWSTTGVMPWGGKIGWSMNDQKRQFGYMGAGYVSNSGPVYRENFAKLNFSNDVYTSFAKTFGAIAPSGCNFHVHSDDFGYPVYRPGGNDFQIDRLNFTNDTLAVLVPRTTSINSYGSPLGRNKTKAFFINSSIYSMNFSTEVFSLEQGMTSAFPSGKGAGYASSVDGVL
jgi:hypothetical protein